MEVHIKIENVHISLDGNVNNLELQELIEELIASAIEKLENTPPIKYDQIPDRTCRECGNQFAPEVPGQIICQECVIEIVNNANKITPHKGSKAHTSASKKCRKCGKRYKPTSNVQKDCPECKVSLKKVLSHLPESKPDIYEQVGSDMISSQGRTLKLCPECSTKFEPSRKHQKYCSPLCKKYAMDGKPSKWIAKPIPCKECGQHFIPKRPINTYCSTECSKLGYKKIKQDWYHSKKKQKIDPKLLHPSTGRPVINDPFN